MNHRFAFVLYACFFAANLLGAARLQAQTDDPDIPDLNCAQIAQMPGYQLEPLASAPMPDFLDVPSTDLAQETTKLDFPAASLATSHLSTAQAATQPEAVSATAGNFPAAGGTYGLNEFINHFAPYEPMYFVGGTQAPNVKFQFSIRYRIFTPAGSWATDLPLLKGFNIAYSQTSFWDFQNPSDPFFYDSSYRPEFFYYLENLPGVKLPKAWQIGFQAGVRHESNGQGGINERSMNTVYVQPILTLSDIPTGLFFTIDPRFYDYISSLSDNPQMPRYRGYVDMQLNMGQRDGLQLAIQGYIGDRFNRGNAQFDLTYPLTKLMHGNIDLSLDAQYFTGYGESLLNYTQRSQIFRFGINLVR